MACNDCTSLTKCTACQMLILAKALTEKNQPLPAEMLNWALSNLNKSQALEIHFLHDGEINLDDADLDVSRSRTVGRCVL